MPIQMGVTLISMHHYLWPTILRYLFISTVVGRWKFNEERLQTIHHTSSIPCIQSSFHALSLPFFDRSLIIFIDFIGKMFTRCHSSYRLSTFSPSSSPSLTSAATATVSYTKPINNLLHCLINSITIMDFSCCCHRFGCVWIFFLPFFLSVPSKRKSNSNSLFLNFRSYHLHCTCTFQFDFCDTKKQKNKIQWDFSRSYWRVRRRRCTEKKNFFFSTDSAHTCLCNDVSNSNTMEIYFFLLGVRGLSTTSSRRPNRTLLLRNPITLTTDNSYAS